MNITSFKGLNNVSDPMRLGMEWLVQADNVDVTDQGALRKREGYALAQAGNFSSAFSTADFSRMYVSVDGYICNFAGVPIYGLISSDPLFWCEINRQVMFNNGIDSGIIMPDDTILPWRWSGPATPAVAAITGNLPAGTYQVRCTTVLEDGRETGASDAAEITLTEGQALQVSGIRLDTNTYISPADSDVYQLAFSGDGAFVWNSTPDALGRDLLNNLLDPLPTGADIIQAWKGRIYAAEYMAGSAQTVVWFSEPLGFHLFNQDANFIIVPGRVTMLAPHDSALLIGTDTKIFAYDVKELNQLADYGVVPGHHWCEDDDKRILFWSKRGLCAMPPFSNLTESQVSVAPGVQAGGTILRTNGQKRFVVALQQGGSAFNSLS